MTFVALKNTTGIGLSILAVLILVFGTIGYTAEGQVENLPTPNVDGFVFFSDEAIPGNPVPLLVGAKTTITWDRDDIFVVIADEGKKSQCDGIRSNGGAGLISSSDSQTCQFGDTGYESTGADGSEGMEWKVMSGEYFAGVGTKSGAIPEGTELNVDYEVHFSAGPATYLFTFLLGIGGIGLSRMK